MQTKKITYGGLLLAAAVLLPQVFHLIGGPGLGTILLPMHIPVLLAGFVVGPVVALIVGILSPICSYIYTGGMMPAIPMLYLMIVELGLYGFSVALIRQKMPHSTWIPLIGGMIAGRIGRGLCFIALTSLFGVKLPAAMGIGVAIMSGLPGIVLQIVLIPFLVGVLKRKEWIKG